MTEHPAVEKKQVPLSNLNFQVESTPCPQCGCPFMLVVVGSSPVGSVLNPLVLPQKREKNGQTTVPMRPVVAWRLCIRCLYRETNVPQGTNQPWASIEQMVGLGVTPAMKPLESPHEETRVLEIVR